LSLPANKNRVRYFALCGVSGQRKMPLKRATHQTLSRRWRCIGSTGSIELIEMPHRMSASGQKRTLPACFGNERGRQLRRPLMQITRRSALRAQSGRWLQQPIVPFASNCYLRSRGLCCHFALSSDISLGVFIPFAK
jgi:hypothetical protein